MISFHELATPICGLAKSSSPSPTGVYFGARDGSVYASNDAAETWQQVAAHLPDVMCVRAARL